MGKVSQESINNNKTLDQGHMWAASFTSLGTKNIPCFDQTIIQPNKVKRIQKERLMFQEIRTGNL
jgi:hypothetical protein